MLNVDVASAKMLITLSVLPSISELCTSCNLFPQSWHIHYLRHVYGHNFFYSCYHVVFSYDNKRNKLPSTQLAGRPDHVPTVNQRLLLLIGSWWWAIRMPETCWALFKRQAINLQLIAASGWLIHLNVIHLIWQSITTVDGHLQASWLKYKKLIM